MYALKLPPAPRQVLGEDMQVLTDVLHDGVNLAAAPGTPVRATADGVVAYAGDQIGVYGGLILINHGGGWISAYGHVGTIEVQRGQSVRGGDIIARSGASGQVQTPQLHFQLRKNRVPVDPVKQLPPLRS